MSNKSKQEELKEKLDKHLSNSSWGVSLFAGHRDVLVDEVAKFTNQQILEVLEKVKIKAGWYSQQFNEKARDSNIEDTLVPLSAIEKIMEEYR